ncbi:MAG: hypothetical protein QOJ65_1502 [Fimbriimonadaceae bacterium]|jgi:hypothetical protein|nr:hypothetical protein [Fimbriimonadaceae bacterium]
MKAKSHWLEIEKDGSEYRVTLRSKTGVIGDPGVLTRAQLQELVIAGPGVIIKGGPLRIYKTEGDIRISFTEEEADAGLSGFDRVDVEEFVSAAREVLGREPRAETQRKPSKTATATKKKAASKKRPASKSRAKSEKA